LALTSEAVMHKARVFFFVCAGLLLANVALAIDPQELTERGIGWSDKPYEQRAVTAQGALDCSNAQLLQCPGAVSGNTIDLPNNVTTYGCVGWNESGGEQVWLFVLSEPRVVTLTLATPMGCDLDVFMLSACDPAACVKSNNFTITGLIPPGSYYIVVDGFNGAACAYTLTTACDPVTIGWCNVQWPPTLTTTAGVASDPVYGQVWIDGVTNQPGATVGLTAELGYGPEGSDPPADPAEWQWAPAVYNLDVGNNDEFMAQLTVPATGTYDYAYRYSYYSSPWIYGDLDGSIDGYSPSQAGALTVNPASAVGEDLPAQLSFALRGANPVIGSAHFCFGLPKRTAVELSIHDVTGRRVVTLAAGNLDAGYHAVSWENGGAARAGVYFARFHADGQSFTRRFTVLR
jgi:hypothetical protein